MIVFRRWALSIAIGYRPFTRCSVLRSGHNRWSKIKHDKAKIDASVSRRNAEISSELIKLSKAFGPDPQVNTALAQLIATAKRQAYPKQAIENAIARGQGVSPSGVTLESVTIEAILPGGVAAIVECQTNSKLRTLQNLNHMIRKSGANTAPTSHLFDKKGRIVFSNPRGLTEEDVFDDAIEAGATEIEIREDDKIEVFTGPSATSAVSQTLAQSLGLRADSSEILWVAKQETAVPYPASDSLDQLLEKLQEDPSVQDVYLNTA